MLEHIKDDEKVCKIVKEFFDRPISLMVNEYIGIAGHPPVELIDHPFITYLDFNPGPGSQKRSISEFLWNEEELYKVRDKVWNELREKSLGDYLHLPTKYTLPFLMKIRPCISVDDFSVLLRDYWDWPGGGIVPVSDNYGEFGKQNILGLLTGCNPRKFMNEKEYRTFENLRNDEEIEVYRECECEAEPDELFSWFLSPEATVSYRAETADEYEFDGYKARIHGKDVLAYVDCSSYDNCSIILNPSKLYDVEPVWMPDLCDESELEEIKAKLGINDEDDDDD